MDKELVILVPNEEAAYRVTKSLRELDEQGVIELYSATVVAKTENGKLAVKERHHLREPFGTVLGVTSGALIGLLGGPAGAAIGATVGGAAGLTGDLAYNGFTSEFVRDVAAQMERGRFAVCASIYEDWTMPLDLELAPFGAIVFRQATDDVVTAQIRADWQQMKDEEAHLAAEIKTATGERKAKLEAKREEVRAKIAAQRERLKSRARELEAGWNAKIDSIKSKADRAKADAKHRHEQHAAKVAHFAAAQKAAFHELFS